MLPELRHAGWILPVRLLKIIGSSQRERTLVRQQRVLQWCTYAGAYAYKYVRAYAYVTACVYVRERETQSYDNCASIYGEFVCATFMDGHVRRRKYIDPNSWAVRTVTGRKGFVRCTYLHKHSPPSKRTTRIRHGRKLPCRFRWRDGARETWRISLLIAANSEQRICDSVSFARKDGISMD